MQGQERAVRIVGPYARALGTTRVARQVPGLHTFWIGPTVCARHGVYANVHLHARHVSYMTTDLADVAAGVSVDDVARGVEALLEVRGAGIRAVMLYSGCPDELVGSDFASMTPYLEERFGLPFVHFGKNRMFTKSDGSFFPSFYTSLFRLLRPTAERDAGVNIVGSLGPLSPDGDLERVLRHAGVGPVRAVGSCATFDDFARMTSSRLNLVVDAAYLEAARDMQERLGIPFVYAPISYDADVVEKTYRELEDALGVALTWSDERARFDVRLAELLRAVEVGEVAPFLLDGIGFLHPFACARALVECGLPVEGVVTMLDEYLSDPDCVSDLAALRALRPDFAVRSCDYKSHMPVVEQLGPYESGFWGFSAALNLMACIADPNPERGACAYAPVRCADWEVA